MPEGNILRLTADRLGAALVGDPLIRVELRWPTVAGVNLAGATLVESVSRGKHLLLRLDTGQTLHTHLRMDGYWRLTRTGSREARGVAPQIRALLGTETWTALGWHLGMLDLLSTKDEHIVVGHLGPDALAPGFLDSTAVDGGLRESIRRVFDGDVDRPICAVLLDQRIVAGIGTIYLAESLWATKTWPWATSAELGPARLARVLATASHQLDRAVQVGRTHGMRAVVRNVHGQHLRFCVRCGAQIAAGSLAGPDVSPDQGTGNRIVFYCPGCQVPE